MYCIVHSVFFIRNLSKFYHKSFLIFGQIYDKSFLISFLIFGPQIPCSQKSNCHSTTYLSGWILGHIHYTTHDLDQSLAGAWGRSPQKSTGLSFPKTQWTMYPGTYSTWFRFLAGVWGRSTQKPKGLSFPKTQWTMYPLSWYIQHTI